MKFAAALQCAPLPYVVDDQAAHRACRVGKEACAIGETGVARGDVKISLVQQSGGPKGRTEGVAVQLMLRHSMQLSVQRCEQLLCGTRITTVGSTNCAGYPSAQF